ncbi:uncharacterized protein [Choristoneura fumiferana]|uniref:uncharacterized protein n=1 Tax=Choristoneura fumiferana TaxID=7141 RepID=UPI003D154A24
MDKCSDVIVSTNSMEQKLLESPSKKKRLLMHTRKRRRNPSIQSLPMLEETEEQDPLPYDIDVSRKKEKDDEENSHIDGHRLVDIKYFFTEIVKISKHESLFECGLSAMEMISERQSGLQSKIKFMCNLCKKEFTIQNSEQSLNKMAVAGTIATGCGNAQLSQISAALDMPVLSEYIYKNSQDEVFDEWEVTAWEEMRRAGEKEKMTALEEGRVTKEGVPMVDVVIDGCWSKRSYKTNYAALSGAAAIIGARFGEVLFMAVKNKYCCICARAEKRKEDAKQHECFKNFCGSSTAMEATILAEGFKQSLEMHGVIYARFVGDGDSNTHKKILETRPYPSITVEKIGCRNHILRNFCNKLQQLKTDRKYVCSERKQLTNEKILRGRKYICDSINYHGSQNQNKAKSIENLHQDITGSMMHAFGGHDKCNKNICSEETKPDWKEISNFALWQQIHYISGTVASQARSLIENMDSNVVERFNGVIAKFVGGKRVNYALKRSYQARCAGAVISFNSGRLHTTVRKTIQQESPLAKLKKYEDVVAEKRDFHKTLKRKKNRQLNARKIDFNYGENASKPDLDPEIFELAKANFLENLKKNEIERRDIEKRTILQSESGEWLELRRNLLTASNFGKVVKRNKTNSCASIVKNMLYKNSIDHVASIAHGKKHEKIALQQLSKQSNLEIKDCGLFIDENIHFLGATPDGITDDMVIELKCPVAPFKMGIDAAINEGKMHFWRKNKKTGQVEVNKNSDWYMQAQGQMHICKKNKCLLAVWFGDDKIKTQTILKDDKFWSDKMEPNLIAFYKDCLLPELVDPRHPRNMSIRDPDYVKIKRNEEILTDKKCLKNNDNLNRQDKKECPDNECERENNVREIGFEDF